MPSAKLRQYLDAENVRYTSILHSVAFTAQEIASLAHIPGNDLAKTVVVQIDGQMALAVVPASKQVALSKLKTRARAQTVMLATEAEFRDAFRDCEPGAMPAVGHPYGIPVYVDDSLVGHAMTFNGGTHRELVRVPWDDYVRAARPMVGTFSVSTAAAVL